MRYFNIIYKSLSILAIGLVAASCVQDLNRYPTNDVTNEKVYNDLESTTMALAKVYGAWSVSDGDIAGIDDGESGFVRCYWNLNELTTDEAICAWNDNGVNDLNYLSPSSSNNKVEAAYYRSIAQIMFANDFIRNVGNAKISDELKLKMKSEARFIRAFQYWFLMDCFANPPFITDKDNIGKDAPKQIQRADLFKYIEEELLDIVKTLPEKAETEYSRAGKNAVYALLARMYLNAKVYTGTERYSDAAKYAEMVINNGYSLMPKYHELFLADNNKDNNEVILAINFDGKKSQGYGGTTFLVSSSYDGALKDALESDNKPIGSDGAWGGNRATFTFSQLFDNNQDSRKLILDYDKYISNPTDFKQGAHVYKYRNVTKDGADGSDATFSDIDFPLFRLAEMYLIYAESALRSGGDKAKAIEYFNKLRERAYGNSSANVTNLELKDIIDERGRELYWEGFRRTDLIRFEMFTTDKYLWDWKGGVEKGQAVSEHYNIFPIPASDRNANSKNLQQNKGY